MVSHYGPAIISHFFRVSSSVGCEVEEIIMNQQRTGDTRLDSSPRSDRTTSSERPTRCGAPETSP